MQSATLEVHNPSGLHARPASVFTRSAKRFEASVEISANNATVNGKSVLEILTAGIGKGTEIVLTTHGPDEEAALAELSALVASGFGE